MSEETVANLVISEFQFLQLQNGDKNNYLLELT